MGTFFTSLALSTPLLLLVAIGYGLKKGKLISQETNAQLANLVLLLFLPVNIFMTIYDADFTKALNINLTIFIFAINIVAIIISVILGKLITKDKRKLGAFLQASCRGNYAILGLPLTNSIYGAEAAALYAVAVTLLTPFYNIYSIAVFEHLDNSRTSFIKQFIKIIKTPIVIATVLAFACQGFHIVLPDVAYTTLSYISKALTAVSLINLGAGFNFEISRGTFRVLVSTLFFKMILIPVLAIGSAIALGYRNEMLIVVLVMATVPVATASYPTAAGYNTDVELTKSSIVYSTVICAVTIPIFLTIVKLLHLV